MLPKRNTYSHFILETVIYIDVKICNIRLEEFYYLKDKLLFSKL